jgi:Flp pilus assembly protein TadB
MNAVGRLIIATLLGAGGVWLLLSGVAQRRPTLARMLTHLGRPAAIVVAGQVAGQVSSWARIGRIVARHVPMRPDVIADLRLTRRSPEVHASYLVAACLAGLFGPSLVLAAGQMLGLISVGLMIPMALAILGAIVGPLIVHNSMRSNAADHRNDLRYQLSSYLDVVTMLLAGNVGNEGALRQAAQAGDGRLFVELRRRILVAETSNRSLVSALAQLGDDLDLVELQQISASASLAASAGAPVAKSLAAKCATLRGALSSEQETDARVRTGKITVPLVGMSLLIMAAVVYPALNFSR